MSIWAVQKAVYGRLSSDSTLAGMVHGIYDMQVPDSVTPRFPYVVIGEKNELPENRHDRLGRRISFSIHIFSRYRGTKEAAEIAARVTELLEGVSLPVDPPWHFITCFLSQSIVMEEDVNQIHIVQRFQAHLETT